MRWPPTSVFFFSWKWVCPVTEALICLISKTSSFTSSPPRRPKAVLTCFLLKCSSSNYAHEVTNICGGSHRGTKQTHTGQTQSRPQTYCHCSLWRQCEKNGFIAFWIPLMIYLYLLQMGFTNPCGCKIDKNWRNISIYDHSQRGNKSSGIFYSFIWV